MGRIKTSALFGPNNNQSECLLCKKNGIRGKFHRHHSTVEARKTLKASNKKTYRCPSCKITHNRDQTGRLKILVSASTLHDAFQHDSYRAGFHYDILTICGATLKTIRLNFEASYKNVNCGMDILVVAGINDIARSNPGQFTIQMKRWHEWIDEQEKIFNVKHSLAFSEIFRPPQHHWFASNGACPEDHVDRSHVIQEMNLKIKEVNESYNRCYKPIGFKNEGRRLLKNGNEQHVWSAWREQSKTQMLHIADPQRAKMLERIEKYFSLNTQS